MAKPGPKSQFTPELLEEIFKRISSGRGCMQTIEDLNLCWSAFHYFLDHNPPEGTLERYAHAKKRSSYALMNEARKIAEDQSRDLMPDGKGGFKSDNTAVQRDRLRIDTLKWHCSVLNPEEFGAKSYTELTGKDGASLIPALKLTIEK